MGNYFGSGNAVNINQAHCKLGNCFCGATYIHFKCIWGAAIVTAAVYVSTLWEGKDCFNCLLYVSIFYV